jgi:hypothetical protein
MIIAGTVANTVKLLTLNSKWQTKKDSGEVLSKEERNERANWTEDDWLKHNFQEQIEQNREANQNSDIRNKIMYGETITPEEEKYLEQNDPSMLQKYKQIKAEKKAYEEKLKSCKTKDDVQKLKTLTLGEYAASLKKVENDPCIPLSEKLAKAQEALAKTRSLQKVELKFMKTAEYANLPTEAEEAEERSEERSLENERVIVKIDDSIKENSETTDNESKDNETEILDQADKGEIETKDDKILQDIENAFQRIQLNATLEEHSKTKIKTISEDSISQQINVTV